MAARCGSCSVTAPPLSCQGRPQEHCNPLRAGARAGRCPSAEGIWLTGFRPTLHGQHRGDMPDRDEAVIMSADDKDDLATEPALMVDSRYEQRTRRHYHRVTAASVGGGAARAADVVIRYRTGAPRSRESGRVGGWPRGESPPPGWHS